MASPSAILLTSGPDRKGLVASISDFVFRNNGNILHADHHIDSEAGLFLMRVEWDLKDFHLSREEIRSAFGKVAQELELDWQLQFSDEVRRAALFVSRHDHCLYDLLYRQRSGELRAEFPLVISNHPDLRPIAESFGCEFLVFPITPETKAEQEAHELEELRKRNIEFVVLARYMQILTEDFIKHFPNRVINIHHSFLPAFAGPRPYHQAFQRGVKIIGATAHYATTTLDDGPIIAQDVVRITHRDSVADLIRKGRDLEKLVLAHAVRLHLENKVLVYGNKTAVFE